MERAAEPQKELEWKTDYLFKSSFKLKFFIGQQKAKRKRKKKGGWGSRKEFLLIQNSITVGDRLLSYLATVCTTNVCVVNPDSFFTVRQQARLCPLYWPFAATGTTKCQGGLLGLSMVLQLQHGLQGAKKQSLDKSWVPPLFNVLEHRSEQNFLLPGVLICHLSLTTRLAACALAAECKLCNFQEQGIKPQEFSYI